VRQRAHLVEHGLPIGGQAAAEWKLPEKYKGYAPTVGALFGGLAGRIATLQKEMKP